MKTTDFQKKSHTQQSACLWAEPSIFNYSDYRAYLKDFYQLNKTKIDGYSFAVFSLRAGIKSPNYLKLVMDGKRNLTPENTLAFARGLGFNETETIYWENLVSYCQAKTATQRQFYLMRLSRTQPPAGVNGARFIREIRDEWDYYSHWHHAAIREMVLLPNFSADPRAIASRLGGMITTEDAQASVALLKRLGFLIENPQGQLIQSQSQVRYSTPGDVANLVVRRFHRATAKLALDCFNDDSEEAHQARFFNGLTLAVNRKTLPLIRAKLVSCIREINSTFSISIEPAEQPNLSTIDAEALPPTQLPADQVYHLNIHLVPLTQLPKAEKQQKARL